MPMERFQGGAGTVASCESEDDHGRIHAGGKPAKARGPEQASENGHGRRGAGTYDVQLSGPNWIMTKTRDFVQVLWNLGVPDGI